MGEHTLFSFFMVAVLLGAFLTISLVPLWANPEMWRKTDQATEQSEDS